jgi:hypothetical protein
VPSLSLSLSLPAYPASNSVSFQPVFLFSFKHVLSFLQSRDSLCMQSYIPPPPHTHSTAIFSGCHGNDKRQVTLISVSSSPPKATRLPLYVP